nr:MAG TPA: hypothetical protein [Caudoviricetes sp.]
MKGRLLRPPVTPSVEHELQSIGKFGILVTLFIPYGLDDRLLADQLGDHLPHPAVAVTAPDGTVFGLIVDKGDITVVDDLETFAFAVAPEGDVIGDLLGEVLNLGTGCGCHGYYMFSSILTMQI